MTTPAPSTGRKVILVVSHTSNGGAQLAAHRTVLGLRARGWDAELWFLYAKGGSDYAGCPVRVLAPAGRPGAAGHLKLIGQLIAAFRRDRPIAVFSFLPLAGVMGHLAALLAGVGIRVASLRSPAPLFDSPMRQLDKAFGTLGIYTGIIAVSRAVADAAKDYPAPYRNRIEVVYNGVEPVILPASQADARAHLGLPVEGPLAACVGRIAAQKNPDFVLDIAERLRSVRIVWVGDGPDADAFKAAIDQRGLEDRVLVTGHMPADQIPYVYAACELLIQPSLFEGQSNTVLEAMSAGRAVLVSDIPTQTETVIDTTGTPCGRVLPLGDPEPWAAEIETLAANPEDRATLGRLAQDRAKDFSVAGQIDGFEAVLTRANE